MSIAPPISRIETFSPMANGAVHAVAHMRSHDRRKYRVAQVIETEDHRELFSTAANALEAWLRRGCR